MSEKLRALALELAIKANPPLMGGTTPGPNYQQPGLLGHHQMSTSSSGSFYTALPSFDKILKDAAAFLAFLAPEKPKPSPKSRKAR